jgi:NAD(P)-dependent dehydrogenase (short-subunit alcohol dehydrogenase family)
VKHLRDVDSEDRTMLTYEGKVALVTGAGGGIGRAHALLLAERGARVVVNDAGVALDGSVTANEPAAEVVEEIRALGGVAVADANSVATPSGGAACVARAIEEFGRIDLVVHNAGISGRSPIETLSEERLRSVVDVHLFGAFHVVQPAWPHFVAEGAGRIVLTTSGVGLFGLPGAAAYAVGKMGLVGLVRTLAIEGAPHGILVNGVAPIAQTRMAGQVFGDLSDKIDPALVASAVVALGHPSCALTGRIISAGGGRVAEVFLGVTPGYFSADLTPEDVLAHVEEITDRTQFEVPGDAMEEVAMTAAHYATAADTQARP